MSWLVPAEVIALREFVDDALHRTAFVDDEQRRVPANARTEDALMTLRDVLAGAVTPEGVLSVHLAIEELDVDALDEEGVPYSVST